MLFSQQKADAPRGTQPVHTNTFNTTSIFIPPAKAGDMVKPYVSGKYNAYRNSGQGQGRTSNATHYRGVEFLDDFSVGEIFSFTVYTSL